MRLKNRRFGRRTGATLRRLSGRTLNFPPHVQTIQKRVEYDRQKTLNFRNTFLNSEERQNIIDEFNSQFDDAGLEIGNSAGRAYEIEYSLNKCRRWELPNLLKENIMFDESHQSNEFEVILTEYNSNRVNHVRTDCIGVHKSKGHVHSVKPRKKYALERNLLEIEQNASVSNVCVNSGNRKKRRERSVEEVEQSPPSRIIKYEVIYDRSTEEYPNCVQRTYNRHRRDMAKVEKTLERKITHTMHYFDLNEEDHSYYSDHFDEDDYDIEDEESQIYYRNSSLSSPSFGDYLDFPTKPVESKKVRLKNGGKEIEYSGKDSKVFIDQPLTTTTTDAGTAGDDVGLDIQNSVVLPKVPTTHSINILKSSATPECVGTIFKSDYTEGASFPRRFVIDVTSSIHETLLENNRVRIINRMNEIGNKVVVIFTKNAETDFVVKESAVENNFISLEEVENFSVSVFGIEDRLNIKYGDLLKNCFDSNEVFIVGDVIESVKTTMKTIINDKFKSTVKKEVNKPLHLQLRSLQNYLQQISEVTTPHELLQKTTTTETSKLQISPSLQTTTCGICFVDLLPSSGGSLGTSLSSCQHWFCDDCWRHHISTRIGRGDFMIHCPELKCNSTVDTPTLMSLISTEQFQKHSTHRQNRVVDSDPSWNWCPNPACEHVGKVQITGEELGFVQCKCGKSWCVGCKADVHWPAPCQFAEKYFNTINKREEDKRANKITSVEVKRCPHCKRVMEKNGGCPNMVCFCGNSFCWVCLKPHYYTRDCEKQKQGTETVKLYPVLLSASRDELLAQAFDFKNLTSRSLFRRIKTDAHKLLTKQHPRSLNANDKWIKTSSEKRICSWCTSEEHLTFHIEAAHLSEEVAEFYIETYHLLEWTFVFMAYLPQNGIFRIIYALSKQLVYILEMLKEVASERRNCKTTQGKKHLKQLLTNGKSFRQKLYVCASKIQQKEMMKKTTLNTN